MKPLLVYNGLMPSVPTVIEVDLKRLMVDHKREFVVYQSNLYWLETRFFIFNIFFIFHSHYTTLLYTHNYLVLS